MPLTRRENNYALHYSLWLSQLNTHYQVIAFVIAFFILSLGTNGSISRLLSILSSWNPNWKPANSMTYCFQAKITSAETVFPGKCTWLDAFEGWYSHFPSATCHNFLSASIKLFGWKYKQVCTTPNLSHFWYLSRVNPLWNQKQKFCIDMTNFLHITTLTT